MPIRSYVPEILRHNLFFSKLILKKDSFILVFLGAIGSVYSICQYCYKHNFNLQTETANLDQICGMDGSR